MVPCGVEVVKRDNFELRVFDKVGRSAVNGCIVSPEFPKSWAVPEFVFMDVEVGMVSPLGGRPFFLTWRFRTGSSTHADGKGIAQETKQTTFHLKLETGSKRTLLPKEKEVLLQCALVEDAHPR